MNAHHLHSPVRHNKLLWCDQERNRKQLGDLASFLGGKIDTSLAKFIVDFFCQFLLAANCRSFFFALFEREVF